MTVSGAALPRESLTKGAKCVKISKVLISKLICLRYFEEYKLKFSKLITAIQGLVTGVAMMVPGVSGGTVAMILGVYDNLITSVSSFSKHMKQSILFLLTFSVPALVGIVLFSKPLLSLIDRYEMVAMYLFMGAVAGSIPMIYREARVHKVNFKFFACIGIGIAIITAIRFIPKDLFTGAQGNQLTFILMQFVGGILVALALVLPGVSVTYMLVVMGLYRSTMTAIGNLDIMSILPLAVSSMIGVVLVAKILERCMRVYPFATYLVILGFILGSLTEVYPGLPSGTMIPLSIFAFAFGFIVIMMISLKGQNKEA